MTPAQVHAAIALLLDGIGSVKTYKGDVPKDLPADHDGKTYPYVVLWPSPGSPTFEPAVSGDASIAFEVQVTVAAGDVAWLFGAITTVRSTLDKAQLDAWTRLRDVTPASRTVIRDDSVKPVRFYVPLRFTTT